MGNEIKRDTCPDRYLKKVNPIKDILPVAFALLVVAFFSGKLMYAGGINMVAIVSFEVLFVCLMTGFVYYVLRGSKARLAETYISVCEDGVKGICPKNGYRNKTFELTYSEIARIKVRRKRLRLYSYKGNVVLVLKDAKATAELIRSKNKYL